jgi:hypothetical protein
MGYETTNSGRTTRSSTVLNWGICTTYGLDLCRELRCMVATCNAVNLLRIVAVYLDCPRFLVLGK